MRLSYSSINTYETCPAKFKFQYEDRLPQAPSPALSFGDSLHRRPHAFHDRPVPVAPRSTSCTRCSRPAGSPTASRTESEEQMYRDHGRQVLAQYHRENADALPDPRGARVPVPDRRSRASSSRARSTGWTGSPAAATRSSTTRRTGGSRRSRGSTSDLQLSIYHLAAKEVWGIEPERLTLYYLLPGQRMTTTRTAADLDDLRRRIAIVAERIERRQVRAATEPAVRLVRVPGACARCSGTGTNARRATPPPRMTAIVDEWIAPEAPGTARCTAGSTSSAG